MLALPVDSSVFLERVKRTDPAKPFGKRRATAFYGVLIVSAATS